MSSWCRQELIGSFLNHNTVSLQNGQQLGYDILIIATGTKIAPQETEGMLGLGLAQRCL